MGTKGFQKGHVVSAEIRAEAIKKQGRKTA